MRKIRGVDNLVSYLKSINCPMSRYTVFKLMRRHGIPFHRPAPHVLIFDLDEIDTWLESDCEEASSK